MAPNPAPRAPSLGGLNLNSLANRAHGETRSRTRGGLSALGFAAQSGVNERRGFFTSNEEAQGREHEFENTQQALDAALARRQQSVREGNAAGARQAASVRARIEREHAAIKDRLDNADWFDRQAFTTDENIRQAKALSDYERSMGGEDEDAGLPQLRDFGGRTIDTARGAALNRRGQTYDLSEEELGWLEDARGKATPQEAAAYLAQPKYFGNRSREASYGLWNTGYGSSQYG